MKVNRFDQNPLVTPADVKPSRPDFEVMCVFNPGVIRFRDEILLLMRVAERPVQDDPKVVKTPVLNCDSPSPKLEIVSFRRDDPNVGLHDPRVICLPDRVYLTSISHLRLARSKDGIHFTVEETPAIFPDRKPEMFGIEDPRITEIDGTYYIVYKSVEPRGITQTLAITRDFINYEKRGIIFCPENMDVCVFPEKVGGRYVALHRPQPRMMGEPNMWVAYSPDLLHWGDHHFLMGVDIGGWCGGRIGGGAIPIKTAKGWLEIYHGATPQDHYCLAAVLLDLEKPEKIIAYSPEPFMKPETSYEKTGFMPNVVFTCGAITDGDRCIIYYGAADNVIAAAEISIEELLHSLQTW